MTRRGDPRPWPSVLCLGWPSRAWGSPPTLLVCEAHRGCQTLLSSSSPTRSLTRSVQAGFGEESGQLTKQLPGPPSLALETGRKPGEEVSPVSVPESRETARLLWQASQGVGAESSTHSQQPAWEGDSACCWATPGPKARGRAAQGPGPSGWGRGRPGRALWKSVAGAAAVGAVCVTSRVSASHGL